MKSLSNCYKLKLYVAPKITDIINFLDNNGKSAVYMGVNIRVICLYLDIIGDPTTLTTSGQHSHHFVHSSSVNNDTSSIHTVIAALCMIQKSIFHAFPSTGQKADAYIIRI